MFFIQYTSRNKLSKVPKQLRAVYKRDTVTKFWEIFNNNNDGKLKLFFSDPLVRLLWKIWSREELASILNDMPEKGLSLIRKDFAKYSLDYPF